MSYRCSGDSHTFYRICCSTQTQRFAFKVCRLQSPERLDSIFIYKRRRRCRGRCAGCRGGMSWVFVRQKWCRRLYWITVKKAELEWLVDLRKVRDKQFDFLGFCWLFSRFCFFFIEVTCCAMNWPDVRQYFLLGRRRFASESKQHSFAREGSM